MPFQMTLPSNIPSSVHYKDKKKKAEPKAKVKYFIKAVLHAHEKDHDMKYKQVLVVREPAVQFKAGEEQKERSNIKTCCCIDQGHSTMWSTFDKNIFTPHETAHATVNVDNSECSLKVTEVSLFVEQKLTLHYTGVLRNHSHEVKNTLVE